MYGDHTLSARSLVEQAEHLLEEEDVLGGGVADPGGCGLEGVSHGIGVRGAGGARRLQKDEIERVHLSTRLFT